MICWMNDNLKNRAFHRDALFWLQGYEDGDVGHGEVACAAVEHPLVPVVVNHALQDDDVSLFEG